MRALRALGWFFCAAVVLRADPIEFKDGAIRFRGQARLEGLGVTLYSGGAAGKAVPRMQVLPGQDMALLSVVFLEPAAGLDAERSVSLDAARIPGFACGLLFSVEKYPLGEGAAGLFRQFPRDINQVGNRKVTDLLKMPRGGNLFLWQESDGAYGVAVPLNSAGCRGWIGNDQATAGLQFAASTFEPGHTLRDELPLALVAFGDDPHALVAQVYARALQVMGASGRLRAQKQYPELFEYLGWCTWEAYREKIDAAKIKRAAEIIAEKRVPVRFVLIDDGWQSVDRRKLTGFDAAPARFPGGLAPLIAGLKSTGRIKWVGVWHTLMGYWDGIDPESALGREFAPQLVQAADGTTIPAPDMAKARVFYEAWHQRLRAQGVDFIKVDDQSRTGSRNRGLAPIDTLGAALTDALEASARTNMQAMLNCMAMGTQCAYHWADSAIVRVSLDYRANDAARSRLALTNGLYNPLWLANFCWPDADMFYSSEQYAPIHALARAISGGPIYLSDPPEQIDLDRVRPLCLADGRILRAEVPALPTADSLFIDPMQEPVLLKAAAVAHGTGVLGLFNLCEQGVPLARAYSSRDLPAGAASAATYFAYSHKAGEGRVVAAGQQLTSPELAPLEGELVIFAPVIDGVAVVGLSDKHLSPAAVAETHREAGAVTITLRDDGEFLAYVAHPRAVVTLDGKRPPEGAFMRRDGRVRIKTALRNDRGAPPVIRISWGG